MRAIQNAAERASNHIGTIRMTENGSPTLVLCREHQKNEHHRKRENKEPVSPAGTCW